MGTGLGVVVPLELAHELPRGGEFVGEADVGVDEVAVGPIADVGQVLEVVGEGELLEPLGIPGEVVGIAERAAVVVALMLVLLLDVGETGLLVERPLAGEIVGVLLKPLVAKARAGAVAVLQVVDAVALIASVDVGVHLGDPEVVKLRAQVDAVFGLLLVVAGGTVLREVVSEVAGQAVLVPAAVDVRDHAGLLAAGVAAGDRAAEVGAAVPLLGLRIDGLDVLHVNRLAGKGVRVVLLGKGTLGNGVVLVLHLRLGGGEAGHLLVLDRERAHVVGLELDLASGNADDLAFKAGTALEHDGVGRDGQRARRGQQKSCRIFYGH